MGDDAAGQFERGVGGILGGGSVRLAGFVPAAGNVGCAQTRNRLHGAEEVVEHIAPVAQHIHDDAAALFLAVVPGRPLRRHVCRPRTPSSRIRRAPKGCGRRSLAAARRRKFQQAGQPELVLHHAVFHSGAFGEPVKIERRFERLRHRLFAVDVLARGDRLAHGVGAAVGGLGVEIDRVSGIGQRRIEIRGPRQAAALRGDGLQLGGIAAHQQRPRHDALAVVEAHARPAA